MNIIIQLVIDALMLGGVYAALAVGLSISFGVMRVINWAHGECFMMGMYVFYVFITYIGASSILATIICGVVLFGFEYVLQRFVFNNILERESER